MIACVPPCRAWTLLGLGLIACGAARAQSVTAGAPGEPGASPAPASVIGEAVVRRLAVAPEARVVILLDIQDVDPHDVKRYRAEVARREDGLLREIGDAGFRPRHRLQSIPLIAGDLRSSGLAALRQVPGILRVDLEQEGGGALAQSVPLIRADAVQALGYTGAGITVGVIDTGIDSDHPDLADAVDPGQACFCTTDCCPNGGTTQLGPGAAEDDQQHGTMVSGVVASNGVVAPRGVAPDAKILAVKVVDSHNRTCCMSDVLVGLDWILVNRPDVDAVNISVVSDALYFGNCDSADGTTLGFARVLGDLRDRGVLTFCAAGNNTSGGAMAMPACVSPAVSMGAVWDANVGSGVNMGACTEPVTAPNLPTCYSNSDSMTDLFAPGSWITTSVIGGGAVTGAGTSFAAPHGAGCAALLRQASPGLSGAALEATLKATGAPVVDPKNGLTFPALDCLAALQARSCPDADGDGFWVPGGASCPGGPYADCDDGDATRFPGNPEVCDGKDNNCDGAVDEGFDPDADGLASCFDNCPSDFDPGQTDRDGDGQGDACDLDDGYIDVRFDGQQSIRWQQEQGWPSFNLYRGSLNALVDTDHDGAADNYGSCVAENQSGPAYNDAAVPPVGQGFLYLVRGVNAGVEGPLGEASSGAPRLGVETCSQVFGVPPVIESVTVTAVPDQVACDFTNVCETWLCTLGVPGALASSPVVLGGGYTHLRIEAHVTDVDSAPGKSDVAAVNATIVLDPGQSVMSLLDDGSLTAFPGLQLAPIGEACSTSGTDCVCQEQTYVLRSNDAAGDDAIFTRDLGLVSPGLPGFLTDCVMKQTSRSPLTVGSAATFQVQVTAMDRENHLVTWQNPPSGAVPPGSYACNGDACGCCLLTATDVVSQCHGLPGMASPDYPAGLCLAF